ncbi:DUF6551 family protein [Mycolicibacter algericus]|uniref:ParB/Sulfiredoxin domain-containing protein n=3 Tax=Mycolicibacter algericus TaxID=1288388 RepID=A0A7I9Y3V7_MYCAL|nr:DUF6551 family protein [Mycolicibacter algericus]OQZ96940.1 hypothetical protein BST10_10215 [Mycolicibacter algericus DSM 45454]GFG83362.1 hypothetical protein MALGJ_00380 [Mycolicibacter algericus]
MTAAAADPDVYVTAIHTSDVFVDTTYQRPCDPARARAMARDWNPRLAGIIEVSDRGPTNLPRYAIIDGQHRWAAAQLLDDPPTLVANVHTGLTVADEAKLFDQLNRARKKVNVFEHYKARLAAGDWIIGRIQAVLDKRGLIVDPAPKDGHIGCVGTLEKVADIDDALLDETLELIIDIWGKRRDALDAPIIHGLALILHSLRDDIDLERLVDALLDVMPRHLKTSAVALRDVQSGTLPVLTALVIMERYNKKPGRKIAVSARVFGGVGRGGGNNHQRKAVG